MPYTQEELKKLSFYQNLISEDEQQYLENKEFLKKVNSTKGEFYYFYTFGF